MKLRAFALPLAGLLIVLAGVLTFGDLNGNLVYYLTPSEAVARQGGLGTQRFRLAGMVQEGSVREDGGVVHFRVADARTTVDVAHDGVPPQLFSDGIEVVVEGAWEGQRFASDTMLVKHDEEYYPAGEKAPGAAASSNSTGTVAR